MCSSTPPLIAAAEPYAKLCKHQRIRRQGIRPALLISRTSQAPYSTRAAGATFMSKLFRLHGAALLVALNAYEGCTKSSVTKPIFLPGYRSRLSSRAAGVCRLDLLFCGARCSSRSHPLAGLLCASTSFHSVRRSFRVHYVVCTRRSPRAEEHYASTEETLIEKAPPVPAPRRPR